MVKNRYLKYFAFILIAIFGFVFTNSEHRYWLLNEKTLPGELTEAAKVAKTVDPKQLACLAKNIFYEANGEPFLGQVAVARVVMNRIQHGFGSNPCNVIYQATYVEKQSEEGETYKTKFCQFSWVCEGKGEPNKNSPGYIQAKQIAYEVLAHDAYNDVVSKSTLFFHNVSVNPQWPYQEVKKIGNHIFYSKKKKNNKSKSETSA